MNRTNAVSVLPRQARVEPLPAPARDSLPVSDLVAELGLCANFDPGPDPSYDPDPIPPDDES